MRQHSARDIHDAKDVDIELLPIFFAWKHLEYAGQAKARVVNKRVNLSEPSDACFNCLADAVVILNVQACHEHVVKADQIFFRIRRAHGGDHIPAVSGETSRGGVANAYPANAGRAERSWYLQRTEPPSRC